MTKAKNLNDEKIRHYFLRFSQVDEIPKVCVCLCVRVRASLKENEGMEKEREREREREPCCQSFKSKHLQL